MRRAFPSAFRRPGVHFLSHPVPATHISAPYGHAHRPSRRVTGFPCSTHFRYDLAGCRLSPEGGGVLAPSPLPLSCHLPDLPRLALATPDICQTEGLNVNEESTTVHSRSPIQAFPLPARSRQTDDELRLLPRASHPVVTNDARHGGDGPLDTGPDYMQLP
jgi:hypothetical protein